MQQHGWARVFKTSSQLVLKTSDCLLKLIFTSIHLMENDQIPKNTFPPQPLFSQYAISNLICKQTTATFCFPLLPSLILFIFYWISIFLPPDASAIVENQCFLCVILISVFYILLDTVRVCWKVRKRHSLRPLFTPWMTTGFSCISTLSTLQFCDSSSMDFDFLQVYFGYDACFLSFKFPSHTLH